MEDKKRTARTVQIVGGVVAAIGVILAFIGTTSMALFILFLLMAGGGAGLIAWGQHLYNETLKG